MEKGRGNPLNVLTGNPQDRRLVGSWGFKDWAISE